MSPALHGAVDLSGLVRKREQANAPAQHNSSVIRSVDDASIGELVELSKTVVVIVEVFGGALTPQLGPLIESYQGRLVLGEVRAESAPELVQALQIQGIPTVLALVGGQPVPLFQGIPPEHEIRPILDQLLELAAKNGVTGSLAPAENTEDQEPELPPLHQEAYDALSRNDIAGAKAAFAKALAQSPADSEAEAGLAQAELLERVTAVDPVSARQRSADNPSDWEAALEVADLDMVGGHIDDAFARLLGLYSAVEPEVKDQLRSRLLSYFVVAGAQTDSVKRARTQLANLMF
jgi:putative thioredoxin